jgi:hypothetical protein
VLIVARQRYTLENLREVLIWLNDWPGGVKLNFELASVFCDAFLWGTGLWQERELICSIIPERAAEQWKGKWSSRPFERISHSLSTFSV